MFGYNDTSEKKFSPEAEEYFKRNSGYLESETRISPQDRPRLSFTIHFTASKQFAETKIDLKDVVTRLWHERHGKQAPLPTHCYVDEVNLLSYSNNTEHGMVLTSLTADMKGGHIHRSSTALNSELRNSLWFMGPNENVVFSSGGINLHEASHFVQSDQYSKYQPLLRRPIESCVVPTADNRYVNYTSHNQFLHTTPPTEQTPTPPDILMLMMSQNESAFKKKVWTSVFAEPDDEGALVTFKIAKEDWDSMMESVDTNVLLPMQECTHDISTSCEIGFAVAPILGEDNDDVENSDISCLNQHSAWSRINDSDADRVSGFLSITLCFPGTPSLNDEGK